MLKKTLLVVLLILVVSAAACAHEHDTAPQTANPNHGHAVVPPHGGHDSPRVNPALLSPLNVVRVPPASFFQRLERELKLTEEQHSKGHIFWDAYLANYNAAVKQVQMAAAALRKAMNTSPLDADAVKDALAKTMKAEEELAIVCINYWTEFRSSLTPEQDKKLSELMGVGPRPAAPSPNTAPTPAAPEKPADK